MKISAILCAAGLSKRMGQDKLIAVYRGKKLMHYALELLERLPADERIVVTTEERLRQVNIPDSAVVYINPDPSEGMSSSVRIGVRNAAGTHYLFLAADQPELTAEDIIPLIRLAEENPGKIIYPLINDKPGNPSVFPSIYRKELLALSGDAGGRTIRDKYPEMCIAYKPDNPERFKDIDCSNDLFSL